MAGSHGYRNQTDYQKGFSLPSDFVMGDVWVTNDGGITWDSSYQHWTTGPEHYTSVFFTSPDTGWVGGIFEDWSSYNSDRNFVILKTTNGGQSWSRKVISPPCQDCYWAGDLMDLFFTDGLHGWAIGYVANWENAYNYVIKTSNGGNSWSLINCNLGEGIIWWDGDHIFFVNNTIGYAIDDYGGNICKSTNGGASFNIINTGYSSHLEDVYFSDPENGWVIGSNGIILYTTNGGISWTHQPSPTGYSLKRILFTDSGDGWIFGDNSTILHLADSTLVSVKDPVESGSLRVSAFPNPFSGSTSISYSLEEECQVNLIVYNYAGQMISELVNERQSKGYQKATWNGENLPSGIYFYRLIADNLSASGKIEKIK
jgi:photosystem II stability/assembly factor-like uncharacterized protein